MSHFRTTVYDDTKALFVAECAASVNGRPGLLHELLDPLNIFVESRGVTINKSSEAAERLPLVNITAGSRASFERQSKTDALKGTASLDLEVMVTGEDEEAAARARDTLCCELVRCLLKSDVLVSDAQQAWSARPWTLLSVDEKAQAIDGVVLASGAVITLSLALQISHEDLPESDFTGLDITVQTRDPDDTNTEAEITVDIEGQEPSL